MLKKRNREKIGKIIRQAIYSEKLLHVNYVNYNGEVFYFQNFKDIISFSSEEVILKLFNGEASIKGENLKINEISTKFISLSGKILKVEVINV